MRIDDLDPPRVVPGVIDNILHTLEGFGLTWDGAVIYQSQRNERYEHALSTLKKQGAVFPFLQQKRYGWRTDLSGYMPQTRGFRRKNVAF